MSKRVEEWMQMENAVVKSYEQLRAENPVTRGNEYNEKIIEPWMEQNRMENELRKKLGAPPDWATDQEKVEFHRRQLALLEKANLAPRCEHIFTDGRRCRSPRVRKGKLCYAHAEMEVRRPQRMNLPPLEDANAVTMWLMEVSRGLLDGTISERTAGLLFYGLQLAMVNARWTTFQETDPREMVRKLPKNSTAPKNLTAKDARGAKEVTAENAEAREKKTDKEITTEGTEVTEEREAAGSEQACSLSRANRVSKETQAGAPALHNSSRPRAAVPHEHPRSLAISGDQIAKSLFTGDEPGREGTSQ